MSKLEKITGEWIKEERLRLYQKFYNENLSDNSNKNSFTLNPNAVKFNQELATLQLKCPHQFENGQCIYCKLKGGS